MSATAQQIANLRTLADFLEDNAEKLTEFHQFNMAHYRAPVGVDGDLNYGRVFADDFGNPQLVGDEIIDTLIVGCATSACAAGWAMTIPGLGPRPEDFRVDDDLDPHDNVFERYIHRVFGIDSRDSSDSAFDDAFMPPLDADDYCEDVDPVFAARRLRAVADELETR